MSQNQFSTIFWFLKSQRGIQLLQFLLILPHFPPRLGKLVSSLGKYISQVGKHNSQEEKWTKYVLSPKFPMLHVIWIQLSCLCKLQYVSSCAVFLSLSQFLFTYIFKNHEEIHTEMHCAFLRTIIIAREWGFAFPFISPSYPAQYCTQICHHNQPLWCHRVYCRLQLLIHTVAQQFVV